LKPSVSTIQILGIRATDKMDLKIQQKETEFRYLSNTIQNILFDGQQRENLLKIQFEELKKKIFDINDTGEEVEKLLNLQNELKYCAIISVLRVGIIRGIYVIYNNNKKKREKKIYTL
jgi:hypothetical protein